MKKAVLFFADGTEECEALIVVDLLRRAEIEVTTASVMGRSDLTTSSNIQLKTDTLIEDIDMKDFDLFILPGGMPGTLHLGNCEKLKTMLKYANENSKHIAAICAAPSVLGENDYLQGKKAICYPGFEEKLLGATISDTDPITDGNITTASGLGHAIPFALELIKVMLGEEKSKEVADSIVY